MSDSPDTLILDLLEWIGPGARPYTEVIDAWRSSCPRLSVWEDAGERGFIERHEADGGEALIVVSARGQRFLATHRPHRAPGADDRGGAKSRTPT